MIREVVAPRADWMSKIESVGLTYHTSGQASDEPEARFWYEGACYRFTLDQIETIEAATEELHRLCLLAVEHVVETPGLLDQFSIPTTYHDYIRRSWRRRDPHIMGRFDLAYDPRHGTVKLLEYNADTPTLVIETAVVQWHWMEDKVPTTDQFNSLHDRLIERFAEVGQRMPPGTVLHFASLGGEPSVKDPERAWSLEEYQHATYFQDLAQQAGLRTAWIDVSDIGWNDDLGFVDLIGQPIRFLHKLYPWEWLATEPFGVHLPRDKVGCVEPVWKMILSNKAILPVLWDLFPHHPNLLASFANPDNPLVGAGRYVEKPILAREGANIRIVRPGEPEVKTDGTYGDSRKIWQAVAELPKFDGQTVIVGSWVVGDNAAGIILREASSEIVLNDSRVVPHYFKG